MVAVGEHINKFDDVPIERLADETNQQPKLELLSEVVRSNFKDYIEVELGYTRSPDSKQSVSAKKARINVSNEIQIGFALGKGEKANKIK